MSTFYILTGIIYLDPRIKFSFHNLMKVLHTIFAICLALSAVSCTTTSQPEVKASANQVASQAHPEQIRYESFVCPDWEKWTQRSYNYGLNPKKVPIPVFFDASISTDATIMVRGNNSWKKRWGLHVFEAYANDDKSRITMILNKHIEEGMPVAELYYYAAVYGQGLNAYNWFRIGSDVPYHSFMFSRDKAIFYGQVDMRNLLTLDNIGAADLLDKMPSKEEIKAEQDKHFKREDYKTQADYYHAKMGIYYQAEAKVLKKQALKNAKNGTIFYDKDHDIVVIKVGGKWKKLPLEDLPPNITYP